MSSKTSSYLLAVAAATLVGCPAAALAKESSPPSAYPTNFKLNEALNFYSVESSSLLKRSMLKAGFSVSETIEVNKSYLDFASRALAAEKERITKIRDALKAKEQVCSAEDGDCADPEASEAKKTKDEKFDPTFGHFLTPDLKPGQADILRWEDNGLIVQDYAVRVGIPPQLISTLKEYAKDMGLFDIMTNMLYDDPLPPDGARWFSFQSPYQKADAASEMRNFTWNVERPAKKWKSDMHWFNTADEQSHEDAMRALAKGGFDEVLKAIGEKLGLDTLHVDSFGFVAVTNCERGFIHTDWEDVQGKAFNFLMGIHSPEDAGPELIVEDDERKGEVYYGSNAGILVGDGTRHGTRECDHREKRGVRITTSIYLADPTRKNLDTLAGDTTSIFPPLEQVGGEWIWAQRGRHWRKDGGGDGLVGDKGRRAFEFEDEDDDCSEDICTGSQRNECLQTCKVFMDDRYYKPGTPRSEVFGY